jgi:hypothetical protein
VRDAPNLRRWRHMSKYEHFVHPINGKLLFREVMMIKKTTGGYKVLSEKGKNLGGPYKTRAEAEKRLRQVEFFKRRKK